VRRGLAELELLRDLARREALPLAQQERATLAVRKRLEGGADLVQEADLLVVGPSQRDPVELDVGRLGPPLAVPTLLVTDIAGDRR
jgi:hypothetical protein